MTEDDKQDPTSAPGSSAADAAPTQEVPRIPKPAKRAPAKKSAAASNGSSSGPQTDKGRPRPTPTPASVSDASDDEDDTSSDSRPLTAADYARTTNQSPSTTAVIPAVKDKVETPVERSTTTSGATLSPAPESGSKKERRASLRLTHIEPWSVTRMAFAISVAMMIVAVVAVSIFWVVMEATGVWDQINGSVTSVLSDDSTSFNITDYLGFGRMVGLTLVLSAINVILTTALATIGAHLYNLAAQLLGGVEVTFAEEK
ncbi:DUF3566 domain-containing protein [Aeromicrobium sp. Root344]|uniref:DUF3566 domain-containing protein n=1 Tax=Aeromicrobium sp. Root344 TaxID=1736521 RepID=UPI000A8539EE|nr:DUF3566 domain-containing protein [Aeromicrobium sp. Root344]